MSLRVLVIPEDPTFDHYVLKPVIQAACRYVGQHRAVVRVLQDPAAKGVDHILSDEFMQVVIDRNTMVDIYLICIDRDGRPGRDHALQHRVQQTQPGLTPHQRIGGRSAEQELEVWCLALHSKSLPTAWKQVREEPHAKEVHFDPLAQRLGVAHSPGQGREVLGRDAAANYQRLRTLCPELQDIERILSR